MGAETVRFDPGSLIFLNVVLALMMYGVSLTVRPADLGRVIRAPQAPAAGLVAQFLFLPALTSLGTWMLGVEPELALGMILVASCPGGSFSNLMTYRARGSVALSVGMTSVSSLAATVLTPANFALWGWVNPHTRGYLAAISIPSAGILLQVGLVLALPLVLGMLTGRHFPRFALRADPHVRKVALVVLLGFVAVALGQNLALFVARFHTFFWLVVSQNLGALAVGALAARALRLEEADRRAVTLEVGIQNSGLGLVIIFTFFPEASGMMLIAAFWGVWHLVTGLVISGWWGARPPVAA
jgi:BASS family bile acid:Na+ symporter